jgi:hypothetical protein
MFRARLRSLAAPVRTAVLVLCVACAGEELPGNYFEVRLEGVENDCTGDAADYADTIEYRLTTDVNDATLAIEDDVFGTGTLEGCQLTYTSLVWTSYRDNQEVTWQILGDARIDLGGGDGCVEAGSDWEGTETFVILSSNADDVAAGCTYTVGVSGTFSRIVE